ncbi:OTU domain-containing protein 2, partial [Tolypocladium paradoxum]
MEAESLEQVQARHRRELKDLQGRITSKKRNASKKTRKGVNDECAEMERRLREAQAAEVAALGGQTQAQSQHHDAAEADDDDDARLNGAEKLEQKVEEKRDEAADADDGSSAPGQPAKKRNRQRERMARRAAEQAAAAQRAADEAATMTDHRARESQYMKDMFKAHGLVEKDIAPDGHCLFSA